MPPDTLRRCKRSAILHQNRRRRRCDSHQPSGAHAPPSPRHRLFDQKGSGGDRAGSERSVARTPRWSKSCCDRMRRMRCDRGRSATRCSAIRGSRSRSHRSATPFVSWQREGQLNRLPIAGHGGTAEAAWASEPQPLIAASMRAGGLDVKNAGHASPRWTQNRDNRQRRIFARSQIA